MLPCLVRGDLNSITLRWYATTHSLCWHVVFSGNIRVQSRTPCLPRDTLSPLAIEQLRATFLKRRDPCCDVFTALQRLRLWRCNCTFHKYGLARVHWCSIQQLRVCWSIREWPPSDRKWQNSLHKGSKEHAGTDCHTLAPTEPRLITESER